MQAFAYSVGVSEAMHGSSEQYRPIDPLEMTALQWHIFKMQHVAMGWKFKVCYFDFCYFKWGSSPSFRGKKQTNKSCASLSDSKCSCGEWAKAERSGPDLQHCCHQKAEHCLSCSYCTRSDLIGSRLDLYMDLETPKVWLFTSWVLAIGLKAEELERRDSSARREWQDQDLKKGMTNRSIYPFLANCWFCCSAVPRIQPLLCCCAAGSAAQGSAWGSPWCSQSPFFRRWSSSGMWLLMALTLWLL